MRASRTLAAAQPRKIHHERVLSSALSRRTKITVLTHQVDEKSRESELAASDCAAPLSGTGKRVRTGAGEAAFGGAGATIAAARTGTSCVLSIGRSASGLIAEAHWRD